MESVKRTLSYVLLMVACNAQTTKAPEEDGSEVGMWILIILIVLAIICVLCCVCFCVYQIIKCLCKGALSCVKSCCKCMGSLVCCPFRFSKWVVGKMCFCRGCNKKVGIQGCTSCFNGAATFFMILRMGIIKSLSPDDLIESDVQKGFLIILFIFISFGIKAYQSWKANKRAKANTQSQNIQAQKVKDCQTTIITLSDTVFKFLSAIAIIIGSNYSGTESNSDCDDDVCRSKAFEYIKYASILGFSEEIIEMIDQYLTMAIFFKKEIKEESEGFTFDAFDNEKEDVEDKVESTMDIQKTILWQAAGASIKMVILLSEQILAFIAAILLFVSDKDEELYFMIAVMACCVIIIFIAFFMCCKFQRLSCGLCCKYYCCCFYNCCADHCESKWIKIDPIENEEAILNHLGQVVLVVCPPPVAVVSVNANPNTINPPLTIQQQQPQIYVVPQQQQVLYQNVQMHHQSQVLQQPQIIQQPQVIQQPQLANQPQPQPQPHQSNLVQMVQQMPYAQPATQPEQYVVQ